MTPGKTNTIISTNNDVVQSVTSSDIHHTMMETNSNNNSDNDIRMRISGAAEPVSTDSTDDKPNSDSHTIYKSQKSTEEKPRIEPLEEGELLGSLVTMNSPAVRTSARVIQKMKQDSIRPTTPPLPDKKDTTKEDRSSQKTPSQTRASKTIWTNVERNLFFEALNEYGKDFEAIAQYINVKQKRKNATDPTYKAKENVRQLYYQSYHKVSKYLRFSDDIKKNVQELYALINYGEMRKRVTFPNQKCFMKLRELVYKGWVSLRWKGKTYRIKTPSCKALRKINQVEEWQEDIKLPLKVDVILRPANSESWCKVQSLAQNPRIKTTLPLQKRLISLFKTLQVKWRSREAKLIEQAAVLIQTLNQKPSPAITSTLPTSSISSAPSASAILPATATKPCNLDNNTVLTESAAISSSSVQSPISTSSSSTSTAIPASSTTTAATATTSLTSSQFQHVESTFYIMPQNDAIIHRPMVNLTEFLSSHSICLNSYEERIGATTKGETLCAERVNTFKELVRTNAKRQRHDSGSEKKSPDMKRTRVESDSEKCDTMNGRLKSGNRDHGNSKMSDDLSTTDEEKYDGDFMGGACSDSALYDMDGIAHMVDSTSADEYEKDDLIKTEIKSELVEDVDGHPMKKDIDTGQEPTLIVPDCIKHNLAKKNRKDAKSTMAANKKRDIRKETFRPLINEEVIKEIRKGWTTDTVGDLTIGDLYIMFGQDSKVLLEYRWDDTFGEIDIKTEPVRNVEPVFTKKSIFVEDNKDSIVNSMPMTNEFDRDSDELMRQKNPLSNKLKQLLMLASMTEKTKRKATCACGHYSDRGLNKIKKDEVLPRSYISNKIYPTSHTDNGLFRQPVIPIRSGLSPMEAYRLHMGNPRNKQNRWLKLRNSRPSKQVVVQRLLPLQPGMAQTYGVVNTNDVEYSGNSNMHDESSTSSDDRTSNNHKHASATQAKSLLTSENLDRINARHYDNNNRENVHNVNKTIDMNHLLDDNDDDEDDEDDHDNEQTNELSDGNDVDEIDADEIDGEGDGEAIDEESRRLNEDPGIQSLMEISLPSPFPAHAAADEYFAYSNGTPPMSPMGILQDHPTDPRWYEENLNDFSLSSFLGHLDASCDLNGKSTRSPSRGVDSSNLSTISETSIDYITKFEELAESMKNESPNLLMQ